jgi:hypothetical protein
MDRISILKWALEFKGGRSMGGTQIKKAEPGTRTCQEETKKPARNRKGETVG